MRRSLPGLFWSAVAGCGCCNSDLNARCRQLCYPRFAGNLFQTSFYDLGLGESVHSANIFSCYYFCTSKKIKKLATPSKLHLLSSHYTPVRSLSAEYSLWLMEPRSQQIRSPHAFCPQRTRITSRKNCRSHFSKWILRFMLACKTHREKRALSQN